MIRLVCCKSWSPLAQLVEHALYKHTGHGSSLARPHKKAKCLYMKWSAARSNARGTEMLAFATYIPQPLPYLELHAVLLKQPLAHQDPPISPYGAAVYWWQASCQGWALALHAASHWSFPLLEDGWGEVPTPHSMLGVTAGCICLLVVCAIPGCISPLVFCDSVARGCWQHASFVGTPAAAHSWGLDTYAKSHFLGILRQLERNWQAQDINDSERPSLKTCLFCMATSRLPHQDIAWNFSCRRTKFPFGWKQPVAKQDLHPQALPPQQHHAFSNTAQIPPELGTPVSVASGRHDRLRDCLWRMPTETGQDKLICAPSAPKAARWWTRPSHRSLFFSEQRYWKRRRRKQCLWESACWNARTLVHTVGLHEK